MVRIADVKLKVEMKVRFEGTMFYIGEVSETCYFFWSNHRNYDGSHGRIDPRTAGYSFSYKISKTMGASIEIVEDPTAVKKVYTKNTICDNLGEFLAKMEYIESVNKAKSVKESLS